MIDQASLIFSTRDDEGEIRVYEDARFRYLTFGNAVEQSCLDLANPARPEHVYTQAMMLVLLLTRRPRHALLLGLGGGALGRALRAAERGLRIVGIERRATVIEVARSHFQLPDDRRFTPVFTDAETFLQRDVGSYDMILADLYLAEGMYPGQVEAGFLALCRERLCETGILVVNQWASEFQANHAASQTLLQLFDGRVLNLHVQGGNIITFALCGELPELRRDAFFAAAQALGLRLGIPLQRQARNLWRQNAEVLAVGRFRTRPRR